MEQRLLGNMKKGFMTLFIVVLMGSISLGLVFLLSQGSFMSIKASNDNKTFTKLKTTVDSCAEIALQLVRENNFYTGSDSVLIDGELCNYVVSNDGGNNRTIEIFSTIDNFTRGLYINIDNLNPISISLWEEV